MQPWVRPGTEYPVCYGIITVKGKNFFLFKEFRSVLGTNQPVVEWEVGAFLKGIAARA